jgi:hypothetical protein
MSQNFMLKGIRVYIFIPVFSLNSPLLIRLLCLAKGPQIELAADKEEKIKIQNLRSFLYHHVTSEVNRLTKNPACDSQW